MGGNRTISLIGAVLVLLVLAAPLAAAEQTFQFDIPGCSA